jgi:hypothetical protein
MIADGTSPARAALLLDLDVRTLDAVAAEIATFRDSKGDRVAVQDGPGRKARRG